MGQTSIPCDSEVRDRLAVDKPEDASWSEYLSDLHSGMELVVEKEQTGVGYDDVLAATRQAIREELPVEEM